MKGPKSWHSRANKRQVFKKTGREPNDRGIPGMAAAPRSHPLPRGLSPSEGGRASTLGVTPAPRVGNNPTQLA